MIEKLGLWGPTLIAILFFTSCNVTQFLPPDEYLYRGADIQIEAADSVPTAPLQADLETTLNDQINTKWPVLGYYKIWRYYKFEDKKRRKPEKYADDPDEIKGEEPIFYRETVVENVSQLLENRAANNGYFTREASYTTDTTTGKQEISVVHTVAVGMPYRLDTVEYYWRDSSVARVIDSVERFSLLRPGQRYDLDRIKAERERWRAALRERGYFFASSDDFLFLADSVAGDRQVKMLAKLKPEVPAQHLRPQRIARVNVFPNYETADTTRRFEQDLEQVGGIRVYCNDCPLRPEILDEAFAMRAGDLYQPERHRKTLERLASYNTFRYISMDYESQSDSTLALNAYMSPFLRRRIEGELGLTYNSARYFGPNVRLAYTNRNLLRGAELFKLEGDFSLATFLGDQDDIRIPRSGTYGLTATLNVPRLWLPQREKLLPGLITSGTLITLGGKLETLGLTLSKFTSEIEDLNLTGLAERVENNAEASETVSLLQVRASYGYTWRRKTNQAHTLNPLSVRFQNPIVSSNEVLEVARSLGLAPGAQSTSAGASRFDRMIVLSPNYTYNYDSRLNGLRTHDFFWQQYISMNWNNIFPRAEGTGVADRISSLYPQLESDFRYYFTFAPGAQLATRLHGGIAFPISDRAIVPYFDLYTIGGPNSLRGFIPRQLGPGRTAPVNNNLLTFGGFGNLLLEASIEYRQQINSLIELAVFYDAGNIWTYRTEAEPLDTDFRRQNFLSELAMNYGVGLRLDLQFLIFRLDFAKPFQIPYEDAFIDTPIPTRVVGDAPDESLRIVFAFGYPF